MTDATVRDLEKSLRSSGRKGPAPVHLWNPPYCGEIGLRIAADGTWYYQDSPIGRKTLVKLYASVLRHDDDGRHYLVTPVEKIGIEVEDAPFLAVGMSVQGEGQEQTLSFRTNVDDAVTAGPDHPMRFEFDQENNGLKPYLHVRGRLEALVTRALTYDLVALALEAQIDGEPHLGIWSASQFFPICATGSGPTFRSGEIAPISEEIKPQEKG
ncbi:hypothetical protein MnTg02_00727 [bacterium MnTg02]|nr:hypothetical protein MnTg02_00727 [bacterium MnTg02]